MKTTRRIITIALTLALILTLAIPALAATGGSLTVNRPDGATGTGTTYKVYKMFDIEAANGSRKNTYKMTDPWEEFASVAGVSNYFVVKDGYILWEKDTTSAADAAAIAQLARAYVESKNLQEVDTVTAGGAALQLTVDGYYLLVPNNDTASGVIVVSRGDAIGVTEKAVAEGMPTVKKTVKEDTFGTYGETNTVDIGQTIEYRTTITAGDGASHYVLHDTFDEHISFGQIVDVKRDGNLVPTTDYDVYTAKDHPDKMCKDEHGNLLCTFHIEFHEDFCKGLADDAQIIVNYTGALQEGADTNTEHTNTTFLTYTEQNVRTEPSTVSTKTFKIFATKQDQDNQPLAGAGFVLRDNIGLYYFWNTETKSVEWVSDIEKATMYTTEADGLIKFFGVDAENFYLVEKQVPGGYTGMKETLVSTKSGDVAAADVVITNTLGTALPETGGIGTTVFYVAGIVLVLGALATLVIIKRKETSAQ